MINRRDAKHMSDSETYHVISDEKIQTQRL